MALSECMQVTAALANGAQRAGSLPSALSPRLPALLPHLPHLSTSTREPRVENEKIFYQRHWTFSSKLGPISVFLRLKSSQFGNVEKFISMVSHRGYSPTHAGPTVQSCKALNGESSWRPRNTSKQPPRSSLGCTPQQPPQKPSLEEAEWVELARREEAGQAAPRGWAPAAFRNTFSWTARSGCFVIKDKSTNGDLPFWGCPLLLPLQSSQSRMGTPRFFPRQLNPLLSRSSCPPGQANHSDGRSLPAVKIQEEINLNWIYYTQKT